MAKRKKKEEEEEEELEVKTKANAKANADTDNEDSYYESDEDDEDNDDEEDDDDDDDDGGYTEPSRRYSERHDSPPQRNPNPEPPKLLESDDGYSDFIIPAAIGIGALALFYSFSKKKNKSKSSPSVVANDDELRFSKGYLKYSVGKNWKEVVLEPYLSEQVEDGNLLPSGSSRPEKVTMSRKNVLDAFRSTHKANTDDGSVIISKLPNKVGVQQFNIWLDTITEDFQENY